jgi:CRP-like cAMP-binding protein
VCVTVHERLPSLAFVGLQDADATSTFELLALCARHELTVGELGDPEDFKDAALLVLEQGVLALRADIPHGRRGIIVCHVRPGAILLPPEPGEALRVLEDAVVVAVPSEIRDRLLAIPAAAQIVVDALATTLRQKTNTIVNLSSFHHVDRLRSKLVQLAQDHGRVGRDGIRIDLRLTHDLLAEMIGSARETVTRALEELQREGFVVRDGRDYILRVSPDEIRLPSGL